MEDGARRLLALLGLAILFEGYGRSLPSTTLAEIGSDLRVGSSDLSFALAFVAAGALGVILLGALADRIGRRRVLLVCIAGYGLLGTLTGLAHTLPVFVGWQAAARMFQEGALTTAAVVATEEMPAARRGAAQGVLGLVNQLGAGIAGLALAIVRVVPGGWRGLMVLNLAPLAALPFLRRALPESHRWSTEKRAVRRPLPRSYHARLAAAVAVAFLAMSYDVAGFAFTAYLPISEHGWSPAATSAMIIIAGGLGLPGWWVGGEVADRLGRRPGAILFLLGLTAAEMVFFRLGTSGVVARLRRHGLQPVGQDRRAAHLDDRAVSDRVAGERVVVALGRGHAGRHRRPHARGNARATRRGHRPGAHAGGERRRPGGRWQPPAPGDPRTRAGSDRAGSVTDHPSDGSPVSGRSADRRTRPAGRHAGQQRAGLLRAEHAEDRLLRLRARLERERARGTGERAARGGAREAAEERQRVGRRHRAALARPLHPAGRTPGHREAHRGRDVDAEVTRCCR